MKKLLLTTRKDHIKLSVKPNAGHVLCLFYVRAYLREGQMHSYFVTGFYFSSSLNSINLVLWREKSDFIFLCRRNFSLLIVLFGRLLWQISSSLAFRAACIVLQLVTLFGFLSSAHSWITDLLLLEKLRSLEKLQVCYCQGLFLILGSLFQGLNVFFFATVVMAFSPLQHLRPWDFHRLGVNTRHLLSSHAGQHWAT